MKVCATDIAGNAQSGAGSAKPKAKWPEELMLPGHTKARRAVTHS